jgi:hypothetical protein
MHVQWVEYINLKVKMYDINPNNVCNFDETNVYYSPEPKHTYNVKGAKTVSVERHSSSTRATVMLGVIITGQKFPPLLIFKAATTGKGRIINTCKTLNKARQTTIDEGLDTDDLVAEIQDVKGVWSDFPFGNVYTVQPKGWMDG